VIRKGHIAYPVFGVPKHELLRDPDTSVCPPGSDCAKAAIWRVQQRLAEPQRREFSMSRFVEKTGYDDAD
jgi:hypothetical protein